MKAARNGTSKLSSVQNIVRGALAQLKARSTPDGKREGWKQEQNAQRQINKAVSQAKRELNLKEFSEFELWLAQQIGVLFPSQQSLGTQLTTLGMFPSEIRSRDLASEIASCIEKLTLHRTDLLIFADKCRQLSDTIRIQDWATATEQLKDIEIDYGYSYWLLENSLAFTQAHSGLEAMKAEITRLSISTFGITKYLLYHFGVRNEPAQNSARYRSNTNKRTEDADLSKELVSYCKFRLHGYLGTTEGDIASILTCEQLTTPVDLFFTLVKSIRHIFEHKNEFSAASLLAATEAAASIRLVTEIIGINNPEIDFKSNKVIHGSAENRLSAYASAALEMVFRADNLSDVKGINALIERGIASQISTRSDGLHAEELSKFVLNLGWLPECIELGMISTIPNLPKLLTNLDLDQSYEADSTISIVGALNNHLTSYVSDLVPIPPQINHIVKLLANGLSDRHDFYEGGSQETLHALTRDCLNILTANMLFQQGETEQCVILCAKTGIDNDKLITFLPVIDLLQGAKWPSIVTMAQPFYLSIFLNHYLRVIDDRKMGTYKRYAVEDMMKQHDCATVIQLPAKLHSLGYPANEIEFLVASVCDAVTIELFPGMSHSRKARQTRYQLLIEIAKLHTKNEPSYLRAAEEIQDSLDVDEGLDVLDDSKVYVDEQSILNSVNQELAADFQRYLKLVESGIGESESLAEIIKSFRIPSAKNFQIPKNDADDLLGELIGSMRERFLFDPAFGLDILIGRRIRHGTIASEIRGVLERAELIGQRPNVRANYDLTPKIQQFCQKLDPRQRKIVTAAFSRFAESIDSLIALLRDEYFNVKSKAKGRGVFDLIITPAHLVVFRITAQSCTSIEQFSKECIVQFWYDLSTRSEVVKPGVEAETKKTLHAAFSKLTDELRGQGVMDAAILSLIQTQSEELQRHASVIASWIRVPQVSVEVRTFTMQYTLDVAVAVVTGQHAKFSPVITSNVPDWMLLETHGFSIVEDALYIALVNIYEHSGKKSGNKVHVDITFDSDSSLANFVILSEIAPNSRTNEKELKLNATRLDIKRRAHRERARQDRDSGLCKLATIVMQSDKANISFGFVDDDMFKLEFDLIYIPPKNSTNTSPQQYELLEEETCD